MPSPLCGTLWLPNGNIMLAFKNKVDATQAKAHASDWVTLLDPTARVPQRTYAGVAHNAPTDIWDGKGDSKMVIEDIEAQNSNTAALVYSIAGISWLNSDTVRQSTGCGLLMINFKSKEAANATINQNL